MSNNKTATPVKRSSHGGGVSTMVMTPHGSIIQLQQTIGNQAVQRLLRSNGRNDTKKTGIQTKLKVSQPGDVYEQEADRVAEQVMKMSASNDIGLTVSSEEERVDRKCSACEMKEEEEKKKLNMSRKRSASSNFEASEEATNEINNIRSSEGIPLDASTRGLMESRFGHNFSRVRIHKDERAAESARLVNALAYTIGNDITFGDGQYQPNAVEGRRLLAHELTHVIQQSGRSMRDKKIDVGHITHYDLHEFRNGVKRVNNKIPEKPILQRLSTDLHFVQKSELPCNDKTAGPCEDIIVRPHPKIIRRSVHPAVREAQCKLNMFHEQQVKQGLPGLVDAPLVLDCIFGQKTFNATVSFQRIVFPKDPQFHTGNIFEKTWAKLDEVTTATPKIPETGIIIPDISGPTPVPLCSAVPTSVPTTCSARHDAYCEAANCFPSNPWLKCACNFSGRVCEAVEAFTFTSLEGKGLKKCVQVTSSAPLSSVEDKGKYLLKTNECIWRAWRDGLEAIHDPSIPVPTTLTPEWASAVSVCRKDGVGSSSCCEAHVIAEQHAIDHCGPYDSAKFGPKPTDVPGAPICGDVVAGFSPGEFKRFKGDFGSVKDRIVFGKDICGCSP